MKHFLRIIVAICIFGSLAFTQTMDKNASQTERDKQELIRLYNETARASEKDRAAILARLLDDNFVSYASSNQPRNKARILRAWATPNSDALVNYSLTSSETTNRTFEFDVWQKSDKGWRRIAHRSTPLIERKAVSIDPKTLDAYAGTYRSEDDNEFVVTRTGENLLVSIADGTKFELPRTGAKIDLSAQNEIEFYSPSDSHITMFFVRDETGKVARAILRYYTAETTIKKIK